MRRKFKLGDYVSAAGVAVYVVFMLVSLIVLLLRGGWSFVAFNKIILLLLGFSAGVVLVMSLRQPELLRLLCMFAAGVLVLRLVGIRSVGAGLSSDAGLDFWYLLGAFATGAGAWLARRELELAPAEEEVSGAPAEAAPTEETMEEQEPEEPAKGAVPPEGPIPLEADAGESEEDANAGDVAQ